MSHDKPSIAAVDWGTTRMRVWLLDTAGRVLDERRSDDGLLTARSRGFSVVLEQHLAALRAPVTLPVIICGMAGSRQGWLEVPYVDVPAPIGGILKSATAVKGERSDIRIIPGLAQRLQSEPEVLRGEETQLAGADLPEKGRHIVCMPGTHSKWIVVEEGVVSRFGTWMTGELFSLLASHSILRHSLGEKPSTVAADNATFRHWCETALASGGDIASRLFSIRAAGLLHGLSPDEAAAALSGLLIGGEIASARRVYEPGRQEIVLISSGALGALYGTALEIAGMAFRPVDADEAVRAGLFAAARRNGMIGNGVAA
ncbi:2-dehydro-3-deoxygalactonokinase [Mesorhizobium sp. J18]|nr:2-dehydro-3-deoxygalactonokinase [Mesorhizobium sp. J18]